MKPYPLILSVCFLSIFCLPIQADDDENEEHEQQAVQLVNGEVVIQLDEPSQEISGLETRKIKQTEYQAEFICYGKAISAKPLLASRNQYLSASAQLSGAKARLSEAEKNISRLRNLHKNEAVSTRKLQTQQSLWQSEKAIVDELSYKINQIINDSRLQWGEHLTQWVTESDSAQFNKLLTGQSTLLKLSLPAREQHLSEINTLLINPAGDRGQAFEASIVSLLPTVDSFSQGLQYILLTDSPKISTGMNFTAWVPGHKSSLSGLIIPETSLAWHLGESFIFIKIADEQFIHRNVTNPIRVANGYFIAEKLSDDEEVVVKGTQMLLSHEFRSQIPDEDDD
mgnify:CR=1 FL=1